MSQIPDTQRTVWDAIQDQLPESRAIVYQMIRAHGGILSMQQVADYLGWPINRVSGRIRELAKAGLIVDSRRRAVNHDTGRHVILWAIPELADQQQGAA